MNTCHQPATGIPRDPKQGFALVITLSLMILLTVIAIGLLSLSSVSLRASNQSQAMQIAQANARMALLLAIGDLQKHAGQDQRVTAIADIAGTADGQSLATGTDPTNNTSINSLPKGLTRVLAGTRYWTGIWKNPDTTPGVSIYSKTPSPSFVNWLVSGSSTVGSGILPSNPIYAVNSAGGVNTKAVVLVGKNSVGSASDPESLKRYVAAPLVNVVAKGSTKPVARFAWWVGDEGVKASINREKTFEDKSNYAALAAQRRGWETVAGFSSYPPPTAGAHAALPKIITLAETSLLIPSVRTPGIGASPLQSVFHSATTDSRAVLSDALNGGTKIDLTAILAGTLPASKPVSSLPGNYPVKGSNIIPTTASPLMKAPKWDALKDFHDRAKALVGGALICKAAASDTTAAIAPLITDFRILMGARITARTANSFNINSCGKIAIIIANPYSCPLKWKEDIEVEVRNQTDDSQQPSRIWNLGGPNVFIPSADGSSEPAVFNKAVFRIASATLAPGEARSYTIASPIKRTMATGTQRVVIDLVPCDATAKDDFNNCVELDNGEVRGDIPDMDVRESAQSTLIMVEMRLAGSANILRRAERFELDNGYYGANIRRFDNTEAAKMTGGPFGLMLYSFQISQPGVDYKALMPAPYEMGQRSSTMRTFTDFNLQATRIRKTITSYNPPPFFMESNDSINQLPTTPPGGFTGLGFSRGLNSPVKWGRSFVGSEKTILFCIPSQLASIAQLQHADLTGDDNFASICHQPGNAVGNSYATPFVKRGLISQARTDYTICPNTQTANNYYDICYLLNAALWDSYFFSTIPRNGSLTPENPSLIRIASSAASADLEDPVKAASQLMLDGAFNCNSTDKNAWKAFLASSKHFKHAADTSTTTNAGAAFPRTLEQISTSATPPTGHNADSFSGFRRLTDDQLDALATEIVKQVRIRGPFVSLSHFVNRALASITTQPVLTRSGALQNAIDESGANINFAGTKNAFSAINVTAERVTLRKKLNRPRADLDSDGREGHPPDADPQIPDWSQTSRDLNFGTMASIIADREMLKDTGGSDTEISKEQGYRSTGIPGWLTQADVLQVIGPSLTTRSDTFRIRTYGEALDSNGVSVAKAYCEAVVQRVPAYVDPADASSERGTELTTLNQTYGRQFKIVSFRWLSSNEI